MTKEKKEAAMQESQEAKLIGELAGGKFGGEAKYKLVIDSPHAGVEAKYFAILRILEDRQPYGRGITSDDGYIIKTKDIYTAGETSSYWGLVEQRKGLQIDKFQQIMTNVGSMTKALFQILRDLRILDERLQFYEDSYKGDGSAEVHLKSVWVDQVEGGIKTPTSVLGLTTQVGFAALADLFYSIHPKTSAEVEKRVEKLKETHGINRKVREVLARKLKQFLVWKENTHKELQVGRDFKLGYLRQHYGVIKLYLSWLRPYLKNVKRLQMQTGKLATDKEIISAFETSRVELEFLAIRTKYEADAPDKKSKIVQQFQNVFPVIRVCLNFVAIPEVAYQSEQQRGAIHRGKTEITIEGFVATKEDIENYKKSLEDEDMGLISLVDSSIVAMEDELKYYLEEADALQPRKREKKDEDVKEKVPLNVLEPFKALGDFFMDLAQINVKGKAGPSGAEIVAAKELAKLDAYLAYYIFKKQHGMITE